MSEITKTIDARGSYCPGPLMELIKTMKKSQVGDILEVWSNDEGSAKDIPVWVKKMGHDMEHSIKEFDYWKIAVKKMK
ncbi:MAG: sulfurtransferase TusA family protein [Paenibacillaceae bacterium]